MSVLVEVPQVFEEKTFEHFAAAFARAGDAGKVIVDAHAVEWITPYGFVGLLVAGQALAERTGTKPIFTAPADRDVAHFFARSGFAECAEEFYEIHGRFPRTKAVERNVLLEVTPIRASEDVHSVVGNLQERSSAILTEQLGLEPKATMGFGMALSEACQNIVEHAGTGGWVSVQSYNWRRAGKKVVVIAVADAGVGFRHTLDATQGNRFGERWGDGAALEAALLQNVSRFREPGRGQGLAGIRKYLGRWQGKISIRSGTARIAIVPAWDDDEVMTTNLAEFPGAQLQLVIPAEARAEK